MAVIDLMQDFHGLTHVGEVGAHEWAQVVRRADQVDIGDRVAVLEQFRPTHAGLLRRCRRSALLASC